jgi:acetylcholinesterase
MGFKFLPAVISPVVFLLAATATKLNVETSIGLVEGFVDSSIPGVRQWLAIPFAEPPIASLRFLPPVPKSRGLPICAKTPAASCQQWLTKLPNIFELVPEFLPPPPFHEDCLYLNIIAPQHPKSNSLPVLIFIHGGQVTWGGINTPYEHPHKWVQRTQEHVVVQVNYRLNIFGFPNALGLDEVNLGILDQRLALEWVRDNIQGFGGDPNLITFWGQSAGGAMVDAHQFAFASDPIFKAVIVESSPVIQAQTGTDANKTSFSYVAQKMGCPINSSAAEEIEYMRKVDAGAVELFLQNHTDTNASPVLYFSAAADGKVAFLPAQYVAKGTAGDFTNVVCI